MSEKKTWLEQFNENYNGLSEQAKDLQNYVKDNGKNAVYIPWAVMERMARQQDPDVILEKVHVADGGLVHTQTFTLDTVSTQKNSAGVSELVHTLVMVLSHMVQFKATFLGMTVIEDYPIQDSGTYAVTKAYDQNVVNKAILRAQTKALSRITGLGLKLYERHDLQFLDDNAKLDDANLKPAIADKPVPASTEVKTAPITRRKNATEPPVAEVKAEPVTDSPKVETPPVGAGIESEDVKTIANLLLSYNDTEERKGLAIRFLRSYNNAFMKQFGFTVTMDETVDELSAKLSKLPDASKFLAAARARGL